MNNFFKKYVKKNLGFINLAGKISGKVFFLVLTSFFSHELSYKDFASFAIFWSALRMFIYFSANNLHIIYFNKVRQNLISYKKWPIEVSSNITITAIGFSFIFTIISFFIFDDIAITLLMFPSILLYLIIKSISEFSKSNDSLFLSIFIEDFLFYLLFFISGVTLVMFSNSFLMIVTALFFSLLLTSITSIILFKRKFKLNIKTYKIKFEDFSFEDFRLGINYSFLRGNEIFANFGVKFFGKIYFGDLFVSYTHIMYQFYNLFGLVIISIISGLQSKITINDDSKFNKLFVKNNYFKVLKTATPFIILTLIIINFFNYEILDLLFSKYKSYNKLLVKVAFTSVLLLIVQPLVFIFIYNNKIHNIKILNITQYFFMIIIYAIPYLYSGFNEEYWLLLTMTTFVIIQGIFAIKNYRTT